MKYVKGIVFAMELTILVNMRNCIIRTLVTNPKNFFKGLLLHCVIDSECVLK